MDKININLLPTEFTKSLIDQSKFRSVQAICVVFILALVFLAISIVAVRFLQSKNISESQDQLKEVQGSIQSLKDKEVALTVLKTRITTIDKLTENPSKQKSIYN